MEAVGAVFRIVEFLADALDLLELVNPWRWWSEWDETGNPVALLFAIFSATGAVVFVSIALMVMLGRI